MTLAALLGPAAPGAVAADEARLVQVGRFDKPVFVTAAPGDTRRLFVVEQTGKVVVVRSGRRLSRPFLDLSREVSKGFEQGLLSIAFAPDYARSRRLYVDYTDSSGHTRVTEFKRSKSSADLVDRRTRRQVLFQRQPYSNHNGGQLQFGPDRMLYVAFGDGGSGGDPQNYAQNLGTRLGKILRIDPRATRSRPYRVPSDNPFRSRSGARPEIWAYGLRNPWRFSFDRMTGDMVMADVGQSGYEEVNFALRGRGGQNYGWRIFEGTHRFAQGEALGHVPPVLEQPQDDGWCSITGGSVVRDRALPGLYGRYVYGDFCRPGLRSVILKAGRAEDDRTLTDAIGRVSTFGEDTRGRVYVASLDGPVYRLAAP